MQVSVHENRASFLRAWGERYGKPVTIVRLPRPGFKGLSLGPYLLKRLLGREALRPNVAYQTRTATRDVRYSSKRAETELAWIDAETCKVADLVP